MPRSSASTCYGAVLVVAAACSGSRFTTGGGAGTGAGGTASQGAAGDVVGRADAGEAAGGQLGSSAGGAGGSEEHGGIGGALLAAGGGLGEGGGTGGAGSPEAPCRIGATAYAFCDAFDDAPLLAGFVPPWETLSATPPASLSRDANVHFSGGFSAIFRAPARAPGEPETFARLVKTFVGPRQRAAMRFAVRVSANAFPAVVGDYHATLGHFELPLGDSPSYFIVTVMKQVGPGASTLLSVRRDAYAAGASLFDEEVGKIALDTWVTIELSVDFVENSLSLSIDGTGTARPLPLELGSAPFVKMHLGGAVAPQAAGNAAWVIHYDDVGITFDP